MGNELQHRTVLLEEAVQALVTRADGVYVDGTFGRGGHSRLVLEKLAESGRLIAFDKDPLAIATALLISAGAKQVNACWPASSARMTPLSRGSSAIPRSP